MQSERNTVYLLGSVHMLSEDNYPLSPVIEAAFDRAEIAVFETDMEAAASPDIQRLLFSKTLYQNGRTLKGSISEKLYRQIEIKFELFGLSIQQFNMFKPVLVGLTLIALEIQNIGLKPELGLDAYFYGKAGEAGKEIQTLESPEFQINLLADLSEPDQESFLLSALLDADNMENELFQLIKYWQIGDITSIDSLLQESLANDPGALEIYDKIAYERNRAWLPKVLSLINSDRDCIIIVGAAHLIGDQSLIDLLLAKGYAAEQL